MTGADPLTVVGGSRACCGIGGGGGVVVAAAVDVVVVATAVAVLITAGFLEGRRGRVQQHMMIPPARRSQPEGNLIQPSSQAYRPNDHMDFASTRMRL